jgi:phage-related protein
VVSIILRKELENKEFKFVDDILFAGSFSCEAVNVDGYILSSNNSLGFHCGETHRDKVKLLELL